MENIKPQIKLQHNPIWLLIGISVVIFLAFAGQSAKLTCKHTQQAGSVNCVKESSLFWVIPLRTTKVSDVRGAQVGESYDDETGDTYRVELLTGHGMVPLNTVYTSGPSTKRDIAGKISAFVQSTTAGSLEVTDPGLLSLENLICTAIWLPLGWGITTILRSFKSGSRLAERTP